MGAIESFEYGINRERWDEDIVCIYTGGHNTRESGEAFLRILEETYRTWTEDKPIFLLLSIASGRSSISPHMRKRLEYINLHIRPQNRAIYVAAVLPPGLLNQILSVFARRSTGLTRERIFTDQEQALMWLQQMRDEQRQRA